MFKTFSTRQEAAELLRQWDIATTRRFREGWKDGALTVTKKLERLRALFRFAQENEWINGNPAAKLKNPVAKRRPTLPFSPEEMIEILNACDEYRGERNKMRAFVLLMRYSGLRVGDAARLARDGIADGKLFLYTAKTGTPVWVPLPPATLDALASFQPANKTYFFWSGESSADTVAKLWMRKLQWLFDRTEIQDAHSHRFRDTFAVEMLPVRSSYRARLCALGSHQHPGHGAPLCPVGQGRSGATGERRHAELGGRSSGEGYARGTRKNQSR